MLVEGDVTLREDRPSSEAITIRLTNARRQSTGILTKIMNGSGGTQKGRAVEYGAKKESKLRSRKTTIARTRPQLFGC
jgi:hypothetical protein